MSTFSTREIWAAVAVAAAYLTATAIVDAVKPEAPKFYSPTTPSEVKCFDFPSGIECVIVP